MTSRMMLVIAAASSLAIPCSAVRAEDAPPSYKASPDIYKVIFEDQNFRVIDAVRKKGQKDNAHSHPTVSVVYFVTDCKDKLYASDGKSRESAQKAGTAFAVPVIHSHSAENIGNGDCHQIFVERK